MTTTQKRFNEIQLRLEQLQEQRDWQLASEAPIGKVHIQLRETRMANTLKEIEILENELLQLSMQLTAERHATEY